MEAIYEFRTIVSIDKIATGMTARTLRREHKATLSQVSALMGVSENFLSLLERGKKNWNERHVLCFNHAIDELSKNAQIKDV